MPTKNGHRVLQHAVASRQSRDFPQTHLKESIMLHEIADFAASLHWLWGMSLPEGLQVAYWSLKALTALIQLIKIMRSEKDK